MTYPWGSRGQWVEVARVPYGLETPKLLPIDGSWQLCSHAVSFEMYLKSIGLTEILIPISPKSRLSDNKIKHS